MKCPLKDDPELARDVERANDFLYEGDPHGLKCPISSHLRRSNPRDSLAVGDPEAMRLADNHLLICRGRPYEEPPSSPGAEPEQGMLFIALNASLSRQFKFVHTRGGGYFFLPGLRALRFLATFQPAA